MVVNGATVEDALIPALARVVESPSLAHKLQSAHRFRTGVVNLSSAERTLVLAALDDRSPALVELRAQLVAHPAWRLRPASPDLAALGARPPLVT